ncbi:MAG: hypothetical protein WCR06_05505 [bacterium]
MSSVFTEVIGAQRRILDSLVDCESRIEALYQKFAVAFPRFAEFWEGLACEERRHVHALKSMHSFLERGQLFQNIGRFDQQKVDGLLAILEEADQNVTTDKMESSEAFAMALRLECSLVESRFYVDVTSDAPAFSAVCRVLRAETEQHVAKLHVATKAARDRSC